MKDLDHIRKTIDECDRKLVEIFEQRMEAVLDVLEYKKHHKLPIFQPDREKDILIRVASYLKNQEFSKELEALYRQILKTSKELQSRHLFPFNIVLIGFMASGKTSVATRLSSLLQMDYIDTDDLIVKTSGISINEIFNAYGEVGFRSLETKAIKGLKGIKNTIISCGGGVVLNEENVTLLREGNKIVWLRASPEETYERLLGDSSRPLLRDNFSLERIGQILETRLPLYEAASDLIIDTDGKDIEEVAMELIEKLLAY